jgi:dihydrolipoamide dehydrogenase
MLEWQAMAYDLVIIGSGPGGYSAAVRAGQYGLKTAIIEKDPKLGGTCLHVGCIPTKAMLHAAHVWEYFKHSEEQGIFCDNPRLDLPRVLKRKDGIVSKHAKGVEMLMKKNKVEWIKGYGKLLGGGKVEVTNGGGTKTVEAKHILIATGSEARMLPGLTPDDAILTNVEILKMPVVPKTLAVIGGGAVGVEFASMFHRFGSKVTILEMLPHLVPREDEAVCRELERVFKKQGLRVEVGAKVENVERTANGVKFRAVLANGKTEEMEVEKLLVAVGRKPNTENIGLENTKVEVDRGYIKTDGYMGTGEPGVYAIGDVVAGFPQLAHAASAEGMVAVAHMAGKPAKPIRVERIPSATYTEPGIGSVGLTEEQAKAAGYRVKVGKFPFLANSKATILGEHDGFVKVVAEEQFGEILGVHIIGPIAYELISEAVTAIESESTVETMMATIHAHPTVYEAMGEAFQSVYGLQINA